MKNLIYLIVGLFLISACKVPDYVPLPKDYKYNVNGSYVMINSKESGKVVGEIITVDDNSMSLLPVNVAGLKIITIEKTEDLDFDIMLCSSSDNPQAITAWAAAMNLTSLGHGYGLVFSLPINAATGIALATDIKNPYSVQYPEGVDWARLHKFARFPQGLPDGVELNDIR